MKPRTDLTLETIMLAILITTPFWGLVAGIAWLLTR
jgi:hypothetical protein